MRALIHRNLLEVNSRDYPLEEAKRLCAHYSTGTLLAIAQEHHFYVACLGGQVVGCGGIGSYWGSRTESYLLTLFVRPDLHGKGIGRRLVQTLEQDSYFQRAERVEVPSSITACAFYVSLGYRYKNGVKQLDRHGLYCLEKFPPHSA